MITLNAIVTACIQLSCGSHYIGAYKCLWIGDRTVYMAFCSKVYYYVWYFFLK